MLDASNKTVSSSCSACQLSKHTRLPFPTHSQSASSRPLQLIHTDVWGPSPTPSTSQTRYYVTFDFSRYTIYFYAAPMYFLSSVPSDVKINLANELVLCAVMEGENTCRANSLIIVQKMELSNKLHVPIHHSGVAERKHITEMGLAMMVHASIPRFLWTESFRGLHY